MSSRFFISLVLVANWLVLAGCSTAKTARYQEASGGAPIVEALQLHSPLFEACAGQYNAKDDESYNHLAWIKATCSDASVRNGDEAVAAAKKACELTAWKNWQWIDTLAAAYAEAGDFNRAIEFQEQALRIGTPTEPEQKEMRERLSLYKQSKPFSE